MPEATLALSDLSALSAASPASPLTCAIWDMGDAHCTLRVADAVATHHSPVLHYLQPGLQLLSQRLFRQRPPQPKHIEQALLLVEDMLAPTTRLLPTASQVLCAHPLVHNLAQHAAHDTPADAQPHPALHLESTEVLLQRRLAQDPDVPHDAQWTAALVLAYEVMAQWEIQSLQLVSTLSISERTNRHS